MIHAHVVQERSISSVVESSMKKLLFIFNAKSGTAGISKHLAEIIDTFVKSGYYVEAYPTQSALDAKKQVIERGNQYDMVVCGGGDGTLNEVASGLMQLKKRPLIGYIPSGSTNDFASSIGLKKGMVRNAKIAMNGRKYKVDIGSFNDDKNFVYVVAFGLFTEVSYATSQKLKNILGHQAYVVEAIKSIPSVKSYRIRFEYDGKVIEDDFIYGMVSNSNSVGGFKGLIEGEVILDDGLYEVTLVKKPRNLSELADIAQALLNKNKKSEYIYSFKTDKLKAYSEEKITWTVDGECGGTHREVTIINNPNAMTIIGAKKK